MNSTQSAIDRFVEHYGEISRKSIMQQQGLRDPRDTERRWRDVYKSRGGKPPRGKCIKVGAVGRGLLTINCKLFLED